MQKWVGDVDLTLKSGGDSRKNALKVVRASRFPCIVFSKWKIRHRTFDRGLSADRCLEYSLERVKGLEARCSSLLGYDLS